ncbi:MAG: hypothetical protein E7434_05615 [Ruminococcaceae bacterium]|nr:hypothetical protein [Oscillospiraceae bacterium]
MKKKTGCIFLSFALLLLTGFFVNAEEAEAQPYTGYYNLSLGVVNSGSCTAMQAMAVSGNDIYSVKIATDNSEAILYRTDRKNGATVAMTVDGAAYAKNLYHANDMCAAEVNGETYLFIATLHSGEKGVVCLKISASTAITHAVYSLRRNDSNGTEFSASGISTLDVSGNTVKLLLTSGFSSYIAMADLNAGNTVLSSALAFQINSANAYSLARTLTRSPNATVTVQGVGYSDDTFYVPLTVDHRSVILLYPNIGEAIESCDTSLTTTLDACIHVSNSGYHSFEIESIGIADGIVYFSTNRMRINNHSMASISFLTESASLRFDGREAVRDDGLYQLCDATDTSYVLTDNLTEGKLTVSKTTGANTEYFGLESDREGCYYIRCLTTKNYLTVYDDHAVGQEKKMSGDQQRWMIKYVGNGKSALISKYNRAYLYYDDSVNLVTTSTVEKTWILSMYKDTVALEALLFDYELYTACYPEETVAMTQAQALAHWKSTGKAAGYIASMFFDAKYYLANNADVAKAYGENNYSKAYSHFVNYGFWEGRQGSMFFSLKDYISRSENADIKAVHYPDKVAVMKHFYQYGANESLTRAHRAGADSFSVMSCVAEYELHADSGYGFLVDYIKKNVAIAKVTTQAELEDLLFDAKYYQENNSKLNENNTALMNMPGDTFEDKLLYHWKNYGISEGLAASVYFKASYYKTKYMSSSATAAEAYAHFVEFGFWDQRSASAYFDGQSYLYGLQHSGSCLHELCVTSIQQATCEIAGAGSTYCCLCKEMIKQELLPALGHSYESVVTAPTCTEKGSTTYNCTLCEHCFVSDETLALGHSYIYSNSGEMHAVTCANCDYSTNEDHHYMDGVCICGAVEITAPVYVPNDKLTFTMSISVGEEMAVSYNILGTAVNSYKDFYLEVIKDVADGEAVETVYGITDRREAMTIKTHATTGEALMYQATYKGINAKEMGDIFSTTLYAIAEDGTIYYGNTIVNSIKGFLIGRIEDSSSIPELKTMAVDMLNYGAAAQVRLDYNADNLVTNDLTQAQLDNATKALPEATDYAAISDYGANLSAQISVAARVQLHLTSIYTPSDAAVLKCIIADAETEKILAELPVSVKSGIMCTAMYDAVGAKEMRRVITATIYEGESAVSKTLSWSVESYVAQVRAKADVADSELNMVNAMLIYGDSVAAYMKAIGQ